MKKLQNKPYVLDLNVINNTRVVLALLCDGFISVLMPSMSYQFADVFANYGYPWSSFQPRSASPHSAAGISGVASAGRLVLGTGIEPVSWE